MSAIAGFFAALPKLLDLVSRLIGFVQRAEFQAWVADLESTIDKLEQAKSVEEKQDAARSLVRVIRTLH